MKLLVLGASGRVGSLVVAGALNAGHHVTCFTRNSSNIRIHHKNLRIKGGNVSDDVAVREAVAGQHAVVVALGAKDISRPHSVNSDGVRRLVSAMQLHKVQRVIMVGNIGLLPTRSGKLQGEVNLPPFLQFVFADQHKAQLTLMDSALDWVTVCPPFMPLGERTGKFRVVVEQELPGAQSISVQDVAAWVLQETLNPTYHRVRVGLAY